MGRQSDREQQEEAHQEVVKFCEDFAKHIDKQKTAEAAKLKKEQRKRKWEQLEEES